MSSPPHEPIVLNYARPMSAPPAIFQLMWRWRSICGICFCASVVGFMTWPLVGLGLFAVAVVAAVFTLLYLWRAARAEVDEGYASRQVALAALLSVFFFLGIWLVPPLVESDLLNWRESDSTQQSHEP